LEKTAIELNGTQLHIASCGSGIDIHYLSRFYNAKILATDYSKEGVERVRITFPNVDAKVEDNERLSFADNYFDWSFIAASLHHLPRPIVGLYELLRVSKQGIIVIEPNDSLLTRLATNLKMVQEYEISGNYVYRISKRDLYKIARSGYCDFVVDRCFAPHRVAKRHIEFIFLKMLTGFCNTFAAPLGNYIIFIIKKRSDTII
jgi:SAM-dependent methyltransferase